MSSRGALPLGQGTPGANSDKSNASAAFLGTVQGKEPLHYLFYKYFKGKLAKVSVLYKSLFPDRKPPGFSDAFPHLTEKHLTVLTATVSHM